MRASIAIVTLNGNGVSLANDMAFLWKYLRKGILSSDNYNSRITTIIFTGFWSRFLG